MPLCNSNIFVELDLERHHKGSVLVTYVDAQAQAFESADRSGHVRMSSSI
jgi:hypothetical protein